MTEPTDWIGGQLTSQAVPPDEHPWIEQFGCTARYRRFRDLVRRYYADHMPLSAPARDSRYLNPGNGWVSRLCHEPRIGWQVLGQMLQPFLTQGNLDLMLETEPIAAEVAGDHVRSVILRSLQSGDECSVEARYVLDATELGDLLPMTGAEYITGAQSRSDTGEPNAIDGPAQPQNVQGLTWVFAMGHDPEGSYVIEKPAQYERWRAYRPSFWPGPLFGFEILNPHTLEPRTLPLFSQDGWDLFRYRQIVDPATFRPGTVPNPVTIVNWPQNDYFEGNIIDEPEDVVSARLHDARQLSSSLLYWLQTEAPRHDGGAGYPGLHLRPDVTGTPDGFAKAPYIRESRRIRARFTVLEQHVAAYTNPGCDRAPEFSDSIGVGAYRIDLHPSTSGANTIDTSTLPFEIPLGALLPVRLRNLLPACKNIGTTHVTNGCYRLHPVEWNIGEAAGSLAVFSLRRGLEPAQVWERPDAREEFQELISNDGIELHWPRLHAL